MDRTTPGLKSDLHTNGDRIVILEMITQAGNSFMLQYEAA